MATGMPWRRDSRYIRYSLPLFLKICYFLWQILSSLGFSLGGISKSIHEIEPWSMCTNIFLDSVHSEISLKLEKVYFLRFWFLDKRLIHFSQPISGANSVWKGHDVKWWLAGLLQVKERGQWEKNEWAGVRAAPDNSDVYMYGWEVLQLAMGGVNGSVSSSWPTHARRRPRHSLYKAATNNTIFFPNIVFKVAPSQRN